MKSALFASHASLFPPEHGGAKSVRHLAESLAAAGVECRVLVMEHPPAAERNRFAGQHPSGLAGLAVRAGEWTHRGVRCRWVAGGSQGLAAALRREIAAFGPDAVFLSDDSLEEGRALFEAGADSGRLVFLAQTIHSLPFGPFALKPSEAVTAALRRAAHIVAPSRFVRDYIAEHLGRSASVRYPHVFGVPPFPRLGRRKNEFVTMINPCPWKGSSILLALARRRPDLRFAAVPTWGATPPLLEELRSLPNMTLLPETPRIDEIFARTRVLLAPSLCQEAFGLVSPEALLRGVPVVASDIAGLRESTLGAATLIPVRPLPFDAPREGNDPSKWVWREPENPVEPWSDALSRLLESDAAYEAASARGREAAERFVRSLAERPLEGLPAGEDPRVQGSRVQSGAT